MKKYESVGDVKDKKKAGRPSKLTTKDEEYLVQTVKRDPNQTLKNMTFALNAGRPETPVTHQTVGRALRKNGVYARIQVAKKELSKENTLKRFQFAKKYSSWDVNMWKRVIFSDEALIDKNNRRSFYFCIPGFPNFEAKYKKISNRQPR